MAYRWAVTGFPKQMLEFTSIDCHGITLNISLQVQCIHKTILTCPEILDLSRCCPVTGHTVLIVGAGFSKPASGPLLRQLLDVEIRASSEANQNILDGLAQMAEEKTKLMDRDLYTLEDLFTEVWREARSGGSLVLNGERVEAATILAEVQIHLASICGRLHLPRGQNLWQKYAMFVDALYRGSKTLNIVSFNYDLLVEQCLDDLELPYRYGRTKDIEFYSSERNKKRYQDRIDITIFKLHGSANWGICRGCQRASQDEGLITAYDEPLILRRR